MTYLDVVPIDQQTVAILESALGARYVLRREDAITLAMRLLTVTAQPSRVAANLGASTYPQPSQFAQPPFQPGPLDPALAGTNAWLAESERLMNKPYTPPQTPATPPSTGGSTTFGGDFRR